MIGLPQPKYSRKITNNAHQTIMLSYMPWLGSSGDPLPATKITVIPFVIQQ